MARLGRILGSLFATSALGAALAFAQPAYLVSDLADQVPPFPEEYLLSSRDFVSANDLVFFFQDDGIHGRELWRTDGTALGTFMIRDLCPGSCGSRTSYQQTLRAVGDWVFFGANDGVHGLELWRTDGTALGTELVADLFPGWRSSIPRLLTEAAGQLFFVADTRVADTAAARTELWRSDGTAAGTYRLPKPAGVEYFAPSSMHVGPGFLYLCNAGTGAQTGLWRTDGSAAGTQFLAPVECWSSGYWKGAPMTVLPSGVLVFSGGTTGLDWEPWRSDGTPTGTFLLADIVPGADGSSPWQFASHEGEVLFTADAIDTSGRHLWRSDGTPAGTVEVPLPEDVEPWSSLGSFSSTGGRFYFEAASSSEGVEPWVLDETGPHLLLDIRPGPDSSLIFDWPSYSTSPFEAVNGDLVFSADDGVFGNELWRSDGSAAGTFRISDIRAGDVSIQFSAMLSFTPEPVFGGRFYFLERSPESGLRLWRTDPSATGVERIETIDGQTSSFEPLGRDRAFMAEPGYGETCFAAGEAHLFFETYIPSPLDNDLYISDGSTAGTELRWSAPASDLLRSCSAIEERLVFFGGGPGDRAVRALGAPPLAEELLLAVPDDALWSTTEPPFLGDQGNLYFGVGSDLWSTGGTPETTTAVASEWINYNAWIVPWSGRILGSGNWLWLTDPNEPSGAILLSEDWSRDVDSLDEFSVYVGYNESHGEELWATDGTPEGTGLLVDILPGADSSFDRFSTFDGYAEWKESRIRSTGSVAVFATNDGLHGDELWVTDGTFLGTGLLKDIYPREYPSTPRHLTRLGNQVLFTAEDEEHGLELWITDGTYEGTHLLKDLAPGAASSVPDDLVVRGGTLYFSAWTPAYGREAWKSDGTTAGTLRITDIAPGSLSSSPQRFVRTSNRLYFTATDQVHGYELWAISDDGLTPLFLDGFESEDTMRWSQVNP